MDYIVLEKSRAGFGPTRYWGINSNTDTAIHPKTTEEDAKELAKQLAKHNRGRTYIVAKVISSSLYESE